MYRYKHGRACSFSAFIISWRNIQFAANTLSVVNWRNSTNSVNNDDNFGGRN